MQKVRGLSSLTSELIQVTPSAALRSTTSRQSSAPPSFTGMCRPEPTRESQREHREEHPYWVRRLPIFRVAGGGRSGVERDVAGLARDSLEPGVDRLVWVKVEPALGRDVGVRVQRD